MNTTPTPPAHTRGDWSFFKVENKHVIRSGEADTTIAVTAGMDPRYYAAEEEANARLLTAAPKLLRIARAAAVSFEEHLSCLRDELAEAGDPEDIEAQIDNYEFLLAEHRTIISLAEGH